MNTNAEVVVSVKWLLRIAPAILLALFVSGPASAESISFDTPDGSQLEAKVDQVNGNLYAEIKVKGTGFAIASWQRDGGIWNSPDEIVADLNIVGGCIVQYSKDYASMSEFSNAVNQSIASSGPSLKSLLTAGSMMNCFLQSDFFRYYVKNVATDMQQGASLFQIPLDKYPPGKHEIFLVTLANQEANADCQSITFQVGEKVPFCDPKIASIQRLNIVIGQPTSEVAALSEELKSKDPARWFESSALTGLKPVDFSYFGNFAKIIGPAATVVGVSMIFSVLIAWPTTLIESTLEAHHDRLERLLKRLMPWRSRKEEVASDE